MKDYRPDIDGLRALAVLPVVLFHADVWPFTGGYVGVDVFFVISGYLITRLLLIDFEARRFSLRHFYARRVRRIFPALFATACFSLIAGYFLLLPEQLANAGQAVRHLAYFFSNHLFWHTQNDYWQQNLLSNQPLLHTWSLAVEEQFYVVIPGMLALWFWCGGRERSGQALKWSIAALAVISFGFSLWLLRADAAGAFYILPSRAWELLIGSFLAAHVLTHRPRENATQTANIAGILGLLLILWPTFSLTSRSTFPGVNALYPSLGAALIIYAGTLAPRNWIGRLLGTRPFVYIGLISYSLYLWHWPILVLLRAEPWYARGLPAVPAFVALPAILAVSWASYRWIERPFRRNGLGATSERRTLVWALLVLIVCWLVGGLATQIGQEGKPIPPPTPAALLTLDRDTSLVPGIRCEGDPSPEHILDGKGGCLLGVAPQAGSVPAFALVGDSHARMWTAAMDETATVHGKSGIALTYSSCAPLAEALIPARRECREIMDASIDFVAQSQISRVVLAGYWATAAEVMALPDGVNRERGKSAFYTSLKRTLERMSAPYRQIYLVLDIPELATDRTPREMTLKSLRHGGRPVYGPSESQHRQRQASVDADIADLQRQFSFIVLDPTPQLCSEQGCLVAVDGRSRYRDKHHLTDAAAVLARAVFEPVFDAAALAR